MLLSKRENSNMPNVNLSYLDTFSWNELGEFQLNIVHSIFECEKKLCVFKWRIMTLSKGKKLTQWNFIDDKQNRLQNYLANSNQFWYKLSLGAGESKVFNRIGHDCFQGLTLASFNQDIFSHFHARNVSQESDLAHDPFLQL